MGYIKAAWLEILDAIEAQGKRDAETHEALPTDEDLLRRVCELPYGQVFASAGNRPGWLPDLREAYNEGRRPFRLDLWAVTRAIKAAGHFAFVHHSGGNTATLFAGRPVLGDEERELRWSAMGGQGWFSGWHWTNPIADTAEFSIGPDLRDGSDVLPVPEHTTVTYVAGAIVGVIESVERARAMAGIRHAARDAVVRVYGPDLADGCDALTRA